MSKRITIAVALAAIGFLPGSLWAQSPWESGTYKNYDPATTTPDASGSGLEGYSLSPAQTQPAHSNPVPNPPSPAQMLAPAQPSVSIPQQTAVPGAPTPTGESSLPAALIDKMFVPTALGSSQAIISVSQLAASKSTNADLQKLAGQVVSLYGPIMDGLSQLDHATPSRSSTARIQSDLDKLGSLSGADFDKEYLGIAGRENFMTENSLAKEIKNGANADYKAFANSHLAAVQAEKKAIHDMQTNLRKSVAAAQMQQHPELYNKSGQQGSGNRGGTLPSFTAPAPQ